jgi:hypothetical protein
VSNYKAQLNYTVLNPTQYRLTIVLWMAILLSSCQIIETSKGRIKIKQQLKSVIAEEYDNAFKIDNVWYYQNSKHQPIYKAVVVDPLDKNISFDYYVENPNSFSFDSIQFNEAYQKVKTAVQASYQFRNYTKAAFPDASVKTNVITEKDGTKRRINHLYVYHTLSEKDSILKAIDTECRVINQYYSEPVISYNFYFSDVNEVPKIPIGENGILKYDIFYDLYQYHYRIDFILQDSVYMPSDETLTLNLSGPIAMTLQKQIRNWLGASTYPETEGDNINLVVDRSIEKDIHWAEFRYLGDTGQPQKGFINVFTYEIRAQLD